MTQNVISKNKVSIAMATYNGEAFLKEQLDSIYNQTLQPFEVIVVDDHSTDSTVSILEEYKEKYSLKYYRNDTNIGYNRNFEKAISLCSGNYIALCDQDDVWYPHKLEITLAKLKSIEDNGPALVSSTAISNNTKGELIADDRFTKDVTTIEEFFTSQGSWQGCTLMFNRALIKHLLPFQEFDEFFFDWYITCVACVVGNVYSIAEPLMFYRRHQRNAVARHKKKIERPLMERLRRNLYTYDKFPFLLYDSMLYTIEHVYNKNRNYVTDSKITTIKQFIDLGKSRNLLYNILSIGKIGCITKKRKQKIVIRHFIGYFFRLFLPVAIRK